MFRAENAESNVPKWIRSEAQTLHTVFVTERYFENYSKLLQAHTYGCQAQGSRHNRAEWSNLSWDTYL